tara:strand:- start:98 stop:364 length:267 start_codon:yes stop_codon:yes gene_type:complete
MDPAQENPEPRPPVPMAEAMRWVSLITTVGLEMVIPILVGSWIDKSWDTSFAMWIGLVIGPIIGFWHLMVLTGALGTGKDERADPEDR